MPYFGLGGGGGQKFHHLEEDEAEVRVAMALTVYGCPLTEVSPFNYLKRVLLVSYDNCPAAIRNLQRSRKKWVGLAWVLGMEGFDVQTPCILYIAVV